MKECIKRMKKKNAVKGKTSEKCKEEKINLVINEIQHLA